MKYLQKPTSMGINNQKLTSAKKTPGHTSGGLLHAIKDLNETDVLLGRGTGPSEHKGNRDFRFLIAKRTTEFHSTANRLTKSRIAEQIVKNVKVKHGRFLRRLDKSSEHCFISDKTNAPALGDVLYIQVDDVTAVLKTKQAFRYCSRTSTSTPRAVALPTIGGIIPPRIPREDLVTALKQEQREEHKSLLADALPLSRAHQVLCEQLQAAEMEVKSAAMLRRMWQNELLAQQQEHQARLITSSLIAAPTSRFLLGPPAHTSTNSLENALARVSAITSSPPCSALVTSAGLEGEGPAQPHAILAGKGASDYMVQQHGRVSHFVAGRPVQTRPTGNPDRGAGLLLSLLDQQARSSAAARMKKGCGGGRFDLPSMLFPPRLSASTAAPPSRGANVHPAAYRYRLHDEQLQF